MSEEAAAPVEEAAAPVEEAAPAPETNWRTEDLAAAGYEGDDAKKYASLLERVPDRGTLVKNYFNAQEKIRKGEISTGLPENPTDEQLSAYRQANGIPEAPDAYNLKLEDGLSLDPEQSELFGSVFEAAHSANVPESAMSGIVNNYMKAQKVLQEKQQAQDGIDSQTAESVLKENWKGDYTANMNLVQSHLAQLPAEIREQLVGGRMANGVGFMNSPEVLNWLSSTARALNPAGTVVPNSNNPMKSIDDEIAGFQKEMAEDINAWRKNKEGNKRLLDLIAAKEAAQKRG